MSTRRVGVAAALVDGALVPGDVTVAGNGTIAAVGVAPAGRRGLAVPGFVDLQVNGFAGVDFNDDALLHGMNVHVAIARRRLPVA